MIPARDEHGLLPPGVHDCTLEEVEAAFGFTERRRDLLMHLRRFIVKELTAMGLRCPAFIDGSFVRGKDQPDDIDLVLDLSSMNADGLRLAMHLRWAHDRVKEEYHVDLWSRHPEIPNDLSVFFQYLGDKGAAELRLEPKHPKGILRVQL